MIAAAFLVTFVLSFFSIFLVCGQLLPALHMHEDTISRLSARVAELERGESLPEHDSVAEARANFQALNK
ncbi:MAG: hypothetical protein JXM70_18890 [Pirellulales bacterium]|nr:hypothetical protein [Pirellulales bacterium]